MARQSVGEVVEGRGAEVQMKLVGIMLCRNEDWVLALSLRVALRWCDSVVILLHGCTDRSGEIACTVAAENLGRIVIIRREEQDWPEMAHRQLMLEVARGEGATHLAIIDADEVLTSNLVDQAALLARASGPIEQYSKPAAVLQLPGYNLRNGLKQYHADGVWGKRWFSTAFADNLDLSWSGEGYHKREPQGAPLRPYRPVMQGQGGIMHLWGASERRLRAKHAWYKLTERILGQKSAAVIDFEYSQAIHGRGPQDNPSTWKYAPVPAEWWAGYAHLMQYLNFDADPWQEAECRRLVDQHGKEITKGLDLFGVV